MCNIDTYLNLDFIIYIMLLCMRVVGRMRMLFGVQVMKSVCVLVLTTSVIQYNSGGPTEISATGIASNTVFQRDFLNSASQCA